jgi:hypothetical protein
MGISGTAAGVASVALVGHGTTRAPERARKVAPPESVPAPRTPVPAPVPPAAPDTAPPAGPSAGTPIRCECGHDAAAHEHYRPGSDCGACGTAQCARYRPVGRRRWWRGAVDRLRRR